MSSIKTQGTHIYFVDASGSSPAVVKLACPTGVSGLGGAKDQIEDTCLDATEDKTYVAGLGTPGQVSVPYNLDPSEASHQVLFDLKESGDKIDWMVCLSDGTAAPTLDSNGNLVAPASRTSIAFVAYVADANLDLATNEIVRGTLTLQRSGPIDITWKS
ncbi:phage tail tube protein [Azonexus caeni]|uniref:phage tail tube protein n=1 Tax=Azonexus caeni TaxID=266126 RepID=UPI003A87608A